MKIDINCDLGEVLTKEAIDFQENIMPYITSANIACGFHAGSPDTMVATIKQCINHQVKIGAHPGFLDPWGFGRRNVDMTPQEASNLVIYQIGALDSLVKSQGARLNHVKPHGALYNMGAKNVDLARAIVSAIKAYMPDLTLYGLSGSAWQEACQELDHPFISEVFADRAYDDQGQLVSRNHPGAMITDAQTAADRIKHMVIEGRVFSINHHSVTIKAQTVCVHGDNPHALGFVKALYTSLKSTGIEVTA